MSVSLCAHMWTTCMPGAQRDRRAPDSLQLEIQGLLCRSWERKPGPLQEQHMLSHLSSSPYLQHFFCLILLTFPTMVWEIETSPELWLFKSIMIS